MSSLLWLSSNGDASAQGDAALGSEPGPAPIPTPTVPVAAPERHTGLYLGTHLGLGELRFRFDEYSFWGRSFPIDVMVGYSLSRNLVLFGTFYDAHVFNPSSSYRRLTDLDLLGVGPGLKYYLPSTDVYVSASLLVSRVSFDNDVSENDISAIRIDEHTHWGVTGRLAIGKDWQVSRGWRLGLEGDLLYGRMDFEWSYGFPDEMATAKGLSLLASANYTPDSVPYAPGRSIQVEVRAGGGKHWNRFDGKPLSGPSLPLGLSVGLLLTRHLVLFGQLSYAHVFSQTASSMPSYDANFYGVGPGAKVTLGSTGIFVTGALLLSKLSFEVDYDHVGLKSYWGLSGDVSLGKEWWISEHWSLGFAGNLLLGRIRAAEDETFTTKGLSLLALATFNQKPVLPGESDKRDLCLEVRGGAGYLWTRFGVDSTLGRSYPFGLSVGWAVKDRLVLLADFSYARYPSLTSGQYLGLRSGNFYGVGPRAKYYLTPTGFFAAGALLVSWIDFTHYAPSFGVATTHFGLSADASFGKEWRVSRLLGLGIAGDLQLGTILSDDDGAHLLKGGSVLAFATLNYQRMLTGETQGAPAATPAYSANVPSAMPPAGHRTHDGLYVGARLGTGWLKLKESGDDAGLSGWGWPFALSAGFAPTPSLVVFGELYEFQVRDPSYHYAGLVDLDLQAIGPGVTYYLMPLNVFASLSVSLAQASYRNDAPLDERYGLNVTSHWGILGRFSLGKEWWVSSDWGLGLAAELLLGRMGGRTGSSFDGESQFATQGFSLLATASFN